MQSSSLRIIPIAERSATPGALIDIETGDCRRAFLLNKEIALVDSRASVEPTAGNRSAKRHHRLACSNPAWSSVLVIRAQSLGS